ncbi:hypothetical protein [Streptomyces litmocidini]
MSTTAVIPLSTTDAETLITADLVDLVKPDGPFHSLPTALEELSR